MGDLFLIEDEAIKSVVLSKINQAHYKGLDLALEIVSPIDKPNMPLVDFIRILSILMDNAIEAAQGTKDRLLQFSYFKDGNKTVLIVANSSDDRSEKINLDQLYEPGSSSKGENRGTGLANVKQLISQFPHLNLKTHRRTDYFRQTLEIWDDKIG